MIKLKSRTWYYIYTDGKEFFISEDEPIRDDSKKIWHHPKEGYRCICNPLWLEEPMVSENIQAFYNVLHNSTQKL